MGRGVGRGGLGGGGSGGDEEALDVGGGLDEGEELVGVGLGSGGVEVVVAACCIVGVVLQGELVEVVGVYPCDEVVEARSEGCCGGEVS